MSDRNVESHGLKQRIVDATWPAGVPRHVLARHITVRANGGGWDQLPGESRIRGYEQVAA